MQLWGTGAQSPDRRYAKTQDYLSRRRSLVDARFARSTQAYILDLSCYHRDARRTEVPTFVQDGLLTLSDHDNRGRHRDPLGDNLGVLGLGSQPRIRTSILGFPDNH